MLPTDRERSVSMVLHRLAVVLVSPMLLVPALAASAAEAAPPAPKNYVALGDSYTAAPLVPPLDLAALGCLRSGGGNYPALAAAKLKAKKVTDVSCGGADTTHVTAAQATPTGFVPPQADVLTKETDLVTIGLGGNDFGVFAALFGVCPSLQKSDPDGAPCKKKFAAKDDKDELIQSIAKTKARLTAVVKSVQKKIKPKATIVLVGYPRIAPAKGTCPELPLAKGDYAYVNTVETELNKAIQAAAKAGNAKYLDVFKASEGHDVCAKAKAWVQGKDIDLMKGASYHPRAEEQIAVADLLVKLISGSGGSVVQAATLDANRERSAALLRSPANRAAITDRLAHSALFPPAAG